MKVVYFANIFILSAALLLSGCATSQTGAQREYDDMYYTSEDRLLDAQLIAEAQQSSGAGEKYPDRNTNPDYYAQEEMEQDPTWDPYTGPYGNTIYNHYDRYSPFTSGYQAMYYDPYYINWLHNNSSYSRFSYDPFYFSNNPYGANGLWASNWFHEFNWNFAFNPWGQRAYYHPYYAYNRGFSNGYNSWYWYNRNYGDYIIVSPNSGRKVSRGMRDEIGGRTNSLNDGRKGRSNTTVDSQRNDAFNNDRNTNDNRGRSTYSNPPQRGRSRMFDSSNSGNGRSRSSGSYNRRDTRSSDSFNRGSNSGSRSRSSGSRSRGSRRDD
jgi:hypothetical protein